MAIYVDGIRRCLPKRRWPFRSACHLFADELEELHEFAELLGLQRAWFQKHPRLPHYDLTASKRAQAVRLGALCGVEESRRRLGS